jgi:phosphohistidine phosphatase
MKRLYLLRHAHSEPRGPGLTDFDRPLDQQGKVEAEAIGFYLNETGFDFDYIMCSAALRCQETYEPLRRLIKTGETSVSSAYYNIPEEEVLEYIKDAPDNATSVLYIGHNPGVAFAILRLARIVPDFLSDGIKPATLVGFQLPIDKWADLSWKQGDVIDVYHPNVDSEVSPAPTKS